MGLFDWLFGRKRDPYGKPLPKSYQDAKPKAFGGPPPPQGAHRPDTQAQELRPRTAYLSWRRRRSKQPIGSVADQPVDLRRHWITSKRLDPPGTKRHLGGTPEVPDPYFYVDRVRRHGLPELSHAADTAALAGITRAELAWFAMRPAHEETQMHYTVRRIAKSSGGTRVLLVPLPKLKAAQRRLLRGLLDRLPLHPAAQGFRRGHDPLSNAAQHVGKDVVISVDIQDFFPSITFRRVSGYFRWLGYGRGTAIALANLMTVAVWASKALDDRGKWGVTDLSGDDFPTYFKPCLPQGAPTSPALANAICRRMDMRLSALAAKFGGTYTRYADDLTLSGGPEMARRAGRVLNILRRIVKTEGFALNEKKTRIRRKGRRQQVTGVVVNRAPNLSRREFDRIKAILTNCLRHGPAGQNRNGHADFRGHLQGLVAHALHIGPARGRKLQALFDKIPWHT